MNAEHLVPVTDATLTDVLATPDPVLLDFGATWCPPCRAMDPHVAALATQYAGRVRVATINIDDNPDAATRFSVRAAPTFLLVRDGAVVERIVGAVPRSKLDAAIRRALGE
jgi:thioredoxin 1